MTKTSAYSATLPGLIGFTALLGLIGGLGLWSVRTEIAGAIIGKGTIVVEHNRQVVQHPEGGVIGTIAARDGDRVNPGDVLLRLDDTLLRSELAVAELQLVELGARRARLTAERDDADQVTFPDRLYRLSADAAATQITGQNKLFHARRASLEKEKSQLGERIKQTGNQVDGAQAQLTALLTQAGLVELELTDQTALLEKGLVQAQRVSATRREAARLAGEIGKLRAEIAQFKGQIAAFRIEGLKLDSQRREAAIKELRDIQFRELELSEKRRGLLARRSRLDIRAPVGGIVYGSTVFAHQAVVQPAEALMYVVPQDAPLLVSARVDAIHIDQLYLGQPASLRFTAFNQRVTPEVQGQVTAISADVFQDPGSEGSYYRISVEPAAVELPKLSDQTLVPGMPVETFFHTSSRTPLSYLLKPFTDYFGRAFRES